MAIELAAILVPLSAIIAGDGDGRLWLGAVLGWGLLALAWIDAEHFWLPDVLTLPLIVLGLGATAVLEPEAITDHALGAALGYAAFRGVDWLYRRLRGRAGLGQGDAKLLAAAGAWLGAVALPSVVLVAATFGLGVARLAPHLHRRGPHRLHQTPLRDPARRRNLDRLVAGGAVSRHIHVPESCLAAVAGSDGDHRS